MSDLKSEIRNPKPERASKSEIRSHPSDFRADASRFWLRISLGLRPSNFGFQRRFRQSSVLCALSLCFVLSLTAANAGGVRVRDLAMIAGARDNQLVGYGLVAGLAGDGDKDPIYTKQTVANMLQRYGINVPPTT